MYATTAAPHLYEFSRVMTTGMSAPPMEAVMCAPSTPARPVVAAVQSRTQGVARMRRRVRAGGGVCREHKHKSRIIWRHGNQQRQRLPKGHCITKAATLTQGGHAGGGVSGAAADEGGAGGGVTGSQADVDGVLACGGRESVGVRCSIEAGALAGTKGPPEQQGQQHIAAPAPAS